MLSINDLKIGTTFKFRDHAAMIVYSEHSKLGRGGGIMRTKIRDLETGASFEHTFKGADKVEEVDLVRQQAQYLYNTDERYFFMDPASFEQFNLNQSQLGESAKYLQEGKIFNILYVDNKPLNLELPIKMTFIVAEADPATRGNTVSGALKNAVLDNNIRVQVPLFIKIGDKVVVDTRTGKYVERAN